MFLCRYALRKTRLLASYTSMEVNSKNKIFLSSIIVELETFNLCSIWLLMHIICITLVLIVVFIFDLYHCINKRNSLKFLKYYGEMFELVQKHSLVSL